MSIEVGLKTLTNFLKVHYYDIIPIPTKTTKEPFYAFKGKSTNDLWNSWNNEGMKAIITNKAQGVSLLLRGDWIVIDFDDKEQADLFEQNCPEFQQAPKQQTKKGFHYYFKRTKACDDNNIYCSIRPFGDGFDIDVLTKRQEGKEAGLISVYPSPNKVWVRSIFDTPLIDLPDTFVDFYVAKTSKSKSKRVKIEDDEDETNQQIDFKTLSDIVSNLNDKRADGYNDWTTAIWAIYNTSRTNGYIKKGKNLIHEFSSRSFKYNEDEVEEYIDNASNRDNGVGLGTLLMMLKEDNEVIFQDIQNILNPVKKVELNGYSIVDEPDIDIFDGQLREYSVIKDVFEKTHFKVMRPLLYVEELENGECYMRDEAEVKKAYRNLKCIITLEEGKTKVLKFINNWIDDIKIRKFDAIDFLPPPVKCSPRTYNMWRGFDAERLEVDSSGNVEPALNHIKILVNHDKKGFDYFVKWLAQIVQQPGKVNGIAIVLKSEQGSGKNRFLDFMHYILGRGLYFETANPVQELWSRFSNGRKNKILINIDETSGKDTYPFSEQLKNMITSPNYNFEHKGLSPITLLNLNRIIFTTNNACPVKVEKGDRRFCVFECSDELKGNTNYFNDFTSYIEDPANQKAFFNYLMNVDISNVDWINDRPITELYRDIQTLNLPIIIKFLIHLYENSNENTKHKFTPEGFYQFYKDYLTRNGYSTEGNITNYKFAMSIKKWVKQGASGDFEGDQFIRKVYGDNGLLYKFSIKDVKKFLLSNKYIQSNEYMIRDDA